MALKISLVFVFCLLATSLISVTFATEGTATFYTKYLPSACYGYKHRGVMIAAASDPLWANGAICGKIFNVTCTGATNGVPHPCRRLRGVRVRVVDHCPNCGGTLDLSKEAFAKIADPVAGVIKIDYHPVDLNH